jgi:pyranose oxidase
MTDASAEPTRTPAEGLSRPSSPRPAESPPEHVDVLIIGSGPIGATFARKLVDAKRQVFMIDAGSMQSLRRGEHLKNAFIYQRNVDLFSNVIKGHLQPLSVPTNKLPVPTLDPGSFRVDYEHFEGLVHNAQNPEQDRDKNLPGAAATYAVGGMATHWTCATPRHHPTIERYDGIPAAEWEKLYAEAEKLLGTRLDQFDCSIRNTVVREALQKEYSKLQPPYEVQNLPLAVKRRKDNPELVTWSGTDTVLGDLADVAHPPPPDVFTLQPQWRCKKLIRTPDGKSIDYAMVEDLIHGKPWYIRANAFVLAAGAILTPQVLFNSGFSEDLPALGKYLSEQPLAFCQIVLKQDILNQIPDDPRFKKEVDEYRKQIPYRDPVPIPIHDPDPQVWIPVSEGRPWHCQIHRDAFQYGELAANVDSRLIVDLRWFGIVQQCPDNYVTFSKTYKDTTGMPQTTFNFEVTDPEDRENHHKMMIDMCRAAGALGGFLPGSEPQFMPPGLPLHMHGTFRMGDDDDPATSVVDTYSKVHGIDNLYLGGNGILPTATASNPTLTSVAIALRAVCHLLKTRPRRDQA